MYMCLCRFLLLFFSLIALPVTLSLCRSFFLGFPHTVLHFSVSSCGSTVGSISDLARINPSYVAVSDLAEPRYSQIAQRLFMFRYVSELYPLAVGFRDPWLIILNFLSPCLLLRWVEAIRWRSECFCCR